MSSATPSPLRIPELLNSILRHVPARDLITKAQLVSKDWQANIKETPILRQYEYLDPSTHTPEGARYEKNELAAFRIPDIFAVQYRLFRGHWSFRHVVPRKVCGMRLARVVRGDRWDWLDASTAWRRLQVSLPSITNLRWEVTRLDRVDETLPDDLPQAVAELHFPTGLCVGDLWDLIASTRGFHNVVWPTLQASELHAPIMTDDLIQQWRDSEDHAADCSLTLVLRQQVLDEDDYYEETNYDIGEDASAHIDKDENESYPHPDAMFQQTPLGTYFATHNVQMTKFAVLDHAEDGAAVPWTYNQDRSNPVGELANLTQSPFEYDP
ncbi:hypothetical protein F5Y13DRAFT_204704 [Hypoxylon sp. FL1857]|nr:hypothetical protein F5Y13DRAFT_204704 [Hypoxylon sp. FL1857]